MFLLTFSSIKRSKSLTISILKVSEREFHSRKRIEYFDQNIELYLSNGKEPFHPLILSKKLYNE